MIYSTKLNKIKKGIYTAVVVLLSSVSMYSQNMMGINISAPSDYQEDRTFADAFKTARPWKKPDDSVSPLDANGWPTGDANTIVWHGINRMNGTYKLSFTGQATITTGFGSATINNKVYNSSTNTTTADVVYNSTGSEGFKLFFTNSGSGVKNVKLMRPLSPGSTSSYAQGTNFTNQLKNLISKFSTIRFMDFTSTNANQSVNWSDRVLPNSSQSRTAAGYGWQGKGGAWEYAILLANETNKDAWICVPAKATNDYVIQLARLFKNGGNGYPALNAGLKLYIEYSNETWNTASAFTQTQWSKDQAVAEVNAGGSPLNYDGNTGQWNWAWRRTAKRIVEISNTFRTEFGDAAMMSRIRPVLMWQQNDGQATANQQLNFIDGYYGVVRSGNPTARKVNYFLYAGGGSAYYNPDNHSDGLTLSNIWSSASFDVNTFKNIIQKDAYYASAFGLKHIAYEGGPSMDNIGHSESIKNQAWSDSRMKTEVEEHHTAWSNQGGELLMYFTSAGTSYEWAFTRDIFNLNTPKLQAIDVLKAGTRAPATLGRVLPGQIDGNAFGVAKVGYKNPGTGQVNIPTNEWFSYPVRSTTASNYNVSLTYKTSAAASINIFLGSTLIAIVNLPNTSGVQQTTATYGLGSSLTANKLYGLRILAVSGSVDIVRLNFNSCSGCREGSDENEVRVENTLDIYPNPASQKVTVNTSSLGVVSILNLNGAVLDSKVSDGTVIEFDLTGYTSGIYLVKTGSKISKLIVE